MRAANKSPFPDWVEPLVSSAQTYKSVCSAKGSLDEIYYLRLMAEAQVPTFPHDYGT